MLRQQRAFERLVQPPMIEQMLKLNRQFDLLRPSYFTQLDKLTGQMASARSAFAAIDTTQLASVRSAFAGIDKLNAQMASLRPSFVGQFADLAKQFSASRGFAASGAIASMLRGYNAQRRASRGTSPRRRTLALCVRRSRSRATSAASAASASRSPVKCDRCTAASSRDCSTSSASRLGLTPFAAASWPRSRATTPGSSASGPS